MDNLGVVENRSWSPSIGLVAVGWIATLAAGTWLVLADTAQDRLVAGCATLAAAVLAGSGTLLRPRLSAGGDGLRVRGPGGTRYWPWGHVRIELARRSRLGITTELLELDTEPPRDGPGLVVLSRLDLGTEPAEVATELERLRPDGERPRS